DEPGLQPAARTLKIMTSAPRRTVVARILGRAGMASLSLVTLTCRRGTNGAATVAAHRGHCKLPISLGPTPTLHRTDARRASVRQSTRPVDGWGLALDQQSRDGLLDELGETQDIPGVRTVGPAHHGTTTLDAWRERTGHQAGVEG